MKKLPWSLLAIAVLIAIFITIFFPDQVVVPDLKASALASDKCYSACTDPNRPYYDMWGNEFDYMGNLIKAAPCTIDPISKKPNPYSCTNQNTTTPEVVNTVKPDAAPISTCEAMK